MEIKRFDVKQKCAQQEKNHLLSYIMEITCTPIQRFVQCIDAKDDIREWWKKERRKISSSNTFCIHINLIWKIMFCFGKFYSIFLFIVSDYKYGYTFKRWIIIGCRTVVSNNNNNNHCRHHRERWGNSQWRGCLLFHTIFVNFACVFVALMRNAKMFCMISFQLIAVDNNNKTTHSIWCDCVCVCVASMFTWILSQLPRPIAVWLGSIAGNSFLSRTQTRYHALFQKNV